ncbi:hypothetical protein ATCVOR07043_383R [Acanthocystis turfacea Chlorella virus OR0704.3]|nr:hypothetical protein ATCVOR07043_383R [Acanthocystis turfacea Chlorella virus OR0704.3]
MGVHCHCLKLNIYVYYNMLLEPVRMNTYEPFSLKKITNPVKNVTDKVADKVVDTSKNTVGKGVVDVGKGVGGKVVDIGKDVGSGVVNVGKDVGGKVVGVGKKVGGALVTAGKAIGTVLKGGFKWLLDFFMMIFKNWKLALSLALSCFVCWFASPVLMPLMRVFSR